MFCLSAAFYQQLICLLLSNYCSVHYYLPNGHGFVYHVSNYCSVCWYLFPMIRLLSINRRVFVLSVVIVLPTMVLSIIRRVIFVSVVIFLPAMVVSVIRLIICLYVGIFPCVHDFVYHPQNYYFVCGHLCSGHGFVLFIRCPTIVLPFVIFFKALVLSIIRQIIFLSIGIYFLRLWFCILSVELLFF